MPLAYGFYEPGMPYFEAYGFYESGMPYFEADSLDVSWATKVQMALALQSMPADIGELIHTMVLQPGVEINIGLLACFQGFRPETRKKRKRRKIKGIARC